MNITYTDTTIIIESTFGSLEVTQPDKDGDVEFYIMGGWDGGANTYLSREELQTLIIWLQKELKNNVRE